MPVGRLDTRAPAVRLQPVVAARSIKLVDATARAGAAEERAGCLAEENGTLQREVSQLKSRSGELSAEVVRLKGRVNRLLEDLKKASSMKRASDD